MRPGWPRAGTYEGSPPRADQSRVETLTWEFALIGGVTGLALTYVLGLVLHIMQPVHLGISRSGERSATPWG